MEDMKKTPQTVAEPIRPFCLEYEDATKQVNAAIYNAMITHNISCYYMKNILSEILHQVGEGAKNELHNAAIAYQKQLEEYKKITEEGDVPNGKDNNLPVA